MTDFAGIFDLGLSGAAILCCIILAIVIYRQNKIRPENGNTKKSDTSEIHARIDDHIKDQNLACSDRMQECNRRFETMSVVQTRIDTTLNIIKDDIKEIKSRFK
jgi:hypothetical protein